MKKYYKKKINFKLEKNIKREENLGKVISRREIEMVVKKNVREGIIIVNKKNYLSIF